MKPNRKDYIHYRLEKSIESLEVAELLAKNSKWNAAINRLYYAVSALLIQFEIIVKSHTGTKTQFFLHFVKTGKVGLDHGKLYADLFDWRQKGDYGDFFDFKEENVVPFIEPTKLLIDRVKEIISDSD